MLKRTKFAIWSTIVLLVIAAAIGAIVLFVL